MAGHAPNKVLISVTAAIVLLAGSGYVLMTPASIFLWFIAVGIAISLYLLYLVHRAVIAVETIAEQL